MEEFIGRSLGPYQIVERLGQGGMATVFKAFQPALQRHVAVKILPPHLAQDPQFSERFTREARAIARLDHPNILPVYDFGVTDGITYIVMKYVEGGTLKDRLEQGRLPLDQAAMLTQQIAAALDYAHGSGVVHRDIKPANVLLARPDWALLSDFGLAKVAEATVKLTGTGVGMGTPEYMAPEQAHGLETDARADIYALGVTIYSMVTGEVPYTGTNALEVILKHVNDPLPSPRSRNPDLPPAAEAAILKAMAKKPDDRQASAGELSKAFSLGLRSRPAPEASRYEAPSPGATVVEPEPSIQPGATRMDQGYAMPAGPVPGRGATVLESSPLPVPAYPPPVVPGTTPSGGVTSLPPAPPAARRGGFPWMLLGVAAVAVVCLIALGGVGMMWGMGLFGGNGGGGDPATPEGGGTITEQAPDTAVPPATGGAAQVEVVARPEGASAVDMYSALQPPSSDAVTPGTFNYRVVFSTQDEVDIGPYWCAIDAATLETNWGQMTYSLSVDGQPVDLSTMRLADYSDGTCRGYFTLARGWSAGAHNIVLTRTNQSEVNDGWCTYGAGDYVDDIAVSAISPDAAAQATQQAAQPLAAGQRVVEDFETDRGIYSYQLACRAVQSVTGGSLRQSVSSNYYTVFAGLPGSYTNLEISADAAFVRVDGTGAEHGLQFRKQNANNYYAFLISDDAQFVFGKLVGGTWTDILTWRAAGPCQGNSGGSDQMSVAAVGSHFEFYCNGALIGEADDSAFSQGAIALETGTYDATYAESTFDNVSMTGR